MCGIPRVTIWDRPTHSYVEIGQKSGVAWGPTIPNFGGRRYAFRQPYEIQDNRSCLSTQRPVSYCQVWTTSLGIGSPVCGFLLGDEKRYETKISHQLHQARLQDLTFSQYLIHPTDRRIWGDVDRAYQVKLYDFIRLEGWRYIFNFKYEDALTDMLCRSVSINTKFKAVLKKYRWLI